MTVRHPTSQPTRASALGYIRALAAGMARSARAVEAQSGITNAQLHLLEQLANGDRATVSELAAHLGVRMSTVSMTMGKLVRRGLVARAADRQDGRRTTLRITASGRRLLRNAPTPPTTRLLDGLRGLTTPELRSLITGLRALTHAMKLDPARAPLMFERAGAAQEDA